MFLELMLELRLKGRGSKLYFEKISLRELDILMSGGCAF